MRIHAISDLHLSFGVDKPMDVFGPHWLGHAQRIQQAWDEKVAPEDWVLVGGDTSWGLRLAEAMPDLQWLGERPGTKVLIRGNHCTWWSSGAGARRKLEAVLHPSIKLLQNNAHKLPDGTVVVGTRLWDPPEAPWADEHAAKVWNSELERLRISIEAGRALGGTRTFALVHYPPRFTDGRTTSAVPLLEAAGVELCVYGHLHGKDIAYGFQGTAGGIRYLCASVDAIDFQPVPAWQ